MSISRRIAPAWAAFERKPYLRHHTSVPAIYLRALLFVLSVCVCAQIFAADLTDADKKFLGDYEKVRAALAADNLKEAKSAATALGEEGKLLAQTESIITARKEFETLSAHAIQLANGQPGFYVVNCPMLRKDWVQTSAKISNPYAGVSMLTCGTIKK